jgi:hypothetical protein
LRLVNNPNRAWVLLELQDGPRETPGLVEAAGRSISLVGQSLTELRLRGLVGSARLGRRREHSLTSSGRELAQAIKKLAAD